MLLSVLADNHVQSIRKLILSQQYQLYDRFIEFNLRFNSFRYTLIQL
jgi:hypothetical protein